MLGISSAADAWVGRLGAWPASIACSRLKFEVAAACNCALLLLNGN